MTISATSLDHKKVKECLGVVTGEAIIGVNLDYEIIESMLMVRVGGTAVKL